MLEPILLDDNYIFRGRRKILTSLLPPDIATDVYASVPLTENALKKDLSEAFQVHVCNSRECQYLLDYDRGHQPILHRIDENRAINNQTVLNFAHAISRNLSSYAFSTGIQYVAVDTKFAPGVKIINDYMKSANKEVATQEIKDYQSVCGHAFMFVGDNKLKAYDSPFTVQALSPVNTFVAYSTFDNSVPVYGCHYYAVKEDGREKYIFQVYTKNQYFIFKTSGIGFFNDAAADKTGPHVLGAVPIIEVKNNTFALGDFEVALGVLNAINTLSSDCIGNIESVVTSYLCLFGVDTDSVDMEEMKKNRVMVFNGAPGINQDAKFVFTQLDGASTDYLRNFLLSALHVITGLPDRDSASTASTTGVAEDIKTGQNDRESIAIEKSTHTEAAERQALTIILNILNQKYLPEDQQDIKAADIDIDITRINRDNLLTKTQAMLNMKQLGMTNDDIVYFGNITNAVSEVAERMTQHQNEMQEQFQQQQEQSVSTEDIVVEEAG